MKKKSFLLLNQITSKRYEQAKNQIDYAVRDRDGRNLLHIAIISDAEKIAVDLICSEIDIDATDRDGLAHLHICAEHDNYYMAEVLLEHRAFVDPVNKYGNAPFGKLSLMETTNWQNC